MVKLNTGKHHIERRSVELFEADGLNVRTFGSARVDSNDFEPEGCEFPSDRAIPQPISNTRPPVGVRLVTQVTISARSFG